MYIKEEQTKRSYFLRLLGYKWIFDDHFLVEATKQTAEDKGRIPKAMVFIDLFKSGDGAPSGEILLPYQMLAYNATIKTMPRQIITLHRRERLALIDNMSSLFSINYKLINIY